MKAHFGSNSYDVFINKDHIKTSLDTFNARRDKNLFCKIADKFKDPREIIQYFVANFAYGNEYSLVDNHVSTDNYKLWLKRKQSITRVFQEDIDKIYLTMQKNNTSKESLFNFVDGDLPLMLKLVLGGHISIETIVIINSFNNMVDNWNSSIVAESSIIKVKKLEKFVKYDHTKIRPIFDNFISKIK